MRPPPPPPKSATACKLYREGLYTRPNDGPLLIGRCTTEKRTLQKVSTLYTVKVCVGLVFDVQTTHASWSGFRFQTTHATVGLVFDVQTTHASWSGFRFQTTHASWSGFRFQTTHATVGLDMTETTRDQTDVGLRTGQTTQPSVRRSPRPPKTDFGLGWSRFGPGVCAYHYNNKPILYTILL